MLRLLGRFSVVFLLFVLLAGSSAFASLVTFSENKSVHRPRSAATLKAQGNIPPNTLVKVVRDGQVVTEKVEAGKEYPIDAVFIVPSGAANNLILVSSEGASYFVEPMKPDVPMESFEGSAPKPVQVPDNVDTIDLNDGVQSKVGDAVEDISSSNSAESIEPAVI